MTIRPGCILRPAVRSGLTGDRTDAGPLPQSDPSATIIDPRPVETAPADTRPVTSVDFPYFRRKLHEQLTFVRSSIRSALLRTDSEQYAQIAGQVHDAQDESLADLFVELNFDEIDRDVRTVLDIDAAQRRILAGTYGGCLDCGELIDWRRLDAHATAKRCLACQVRYEHGGKATPRL